MSLRVPEGFKVSLLLRGFGTLYGLQKVPTRLVEGFCRGSMGLEFRVNPKA